MKTLIDIECFPNFFMLGVWDYNTKEKRYWEISEHRDDRKELFKFLSDYKGYWISFNGKHYDDVVLTWFVKQYYEDLHELSVSQLTFKLKEFSDKVINSEQLGNYEELKVYKYGWSKKVIQVDLFLFWSKGLRLSKKISLKSLAVQLNWNHIQELPYPHNSHLSKEEIEEVKKYNLNNDLGILNKLTDRMTGDIQLRKEVINTYNFDNTVFTWDAPKIASEILLNEYCNLSNQDKKEIRDKRFISSDFKLGDVIPFVKFKTNVFQDLYEEIKNSGRDFSKTIIYRNNNTALKVSWGIGGIHSIQENQIFRSDKNNVIYTSDVNLLRLNLANCWKLLRVRYTTTKSEKIIVNV